MIALISVYLNIHRKHTQSSTVFLLWQVHTSNWVLVRKVSLVKEPPVNKVKRVDVKLHKDVNSFTENWLY